MYCISVKPDIPSWILKYDRKSRSVKPNIFKFNGVRLIVLIVIINALNLNVHIHSIGLVMFQIQSSLHIPNLSVHNVFSKPISCFQDLWLSNSVVPCCRGNC